MADKRMEGGRQTRVACFPAACCCVLFRRAPKREKGNQSSGGNAAVTSQISSPHFCCFNSCFSLFYFQLNISTPTKHLAHHLLHVWHTSSSSASKLPCHPLYAFHTAHSVHYFWRNHIHHLLLKSGHTGHLVWIYSSWICWHILQ